MPTTHLRKALTQVFGALHANTHPYYAAIAGDVLWTDRFTYPSQLQYRLAFNLCGAEENDPAYFLVDFWWSPPLMKGTLMGEDIPHFDPDGNGVYTSVEDIERLKTLVDSTMSKRIDARHAEMLRRRARA